MRRMSWRRAECGHKPAEPLSIGRSALAGRSAPLLAAALVLVTTGPVLAGRGPGRPDRFLDGVDANYSLDLARQGIRWEGGKDADLFRALHKAGVNAFRVRVWTQDSGPSGRDYAATVAKQAQRAGLSPYLTLFLSEDWADYVKQPPPAAWRELPLDEKVERVRDYCQRTAAFFRDQGIKPSLYEIGNEIDFGICGEFEQAWEKRVSLPYMKQAVWPRAAEVILAAEDGVRRIDRRAAFMLHLTQWWNPGFCIEFLQTMRQLGVQVDYLGLTFYPTAGLSKERTFDDLASSVAQVARATGRPVIICEYAYPSLSRFGGQFADWNHAVPGYPLTEEGQRTWVRDFLASCRSNPSVHGAFYWSPEWRAGGMWEAFALYRQDGSAKPALAALGRAR